MDRPDIIFIVVDALREDHAGVLEDKLGEFGFISYENAIAPASWTTPSHASILTGLYPAFHGAHVTRKRKALGTILTGKHPSLPGDLREMGYASHLISANPYVSPHYGFADFDRYHDVPCAPSLDLLSTRDREFLDSLREESKQRLRWALLRNRRYKLLTKVFLDRIGGRQFRYLSSLLTHWPKDKGGGILVDHIGDIVGSGDEKAKFIFVNMMEVHEPYFLNDNLGGSAFRDNITTGNLDVSLRSKWKQKYAEAVDYATKKILEVVKVLEAGKRFGSSLVLVTSDHGQLLGDHGRISHGTFLYDELLRVPLLVKHPADQGIEHVGGNDGYVGLSRLKPFILGSIGQRSRSDAVLYSDLVFAESYGVHRRISGHLSGEERRNVEMLEKYRIAIYHENVRAVFNVSDWRFEEISSLSGDSIVSDKISKRIRRRVLQFLSLGKVTKTVGRREV